MLLKTPGDGQQVGSRLCGPVNGLKVGPPVLSSTFFFFLTIMMCLSILDYDVFSYDVHKGHLRISLASSNPQIRTSGPDWRM